MQALIAPLKELAEYDEIRKVTRQGKGTVALSGCVDSQKLHMIYGLSDGLKYKVIVTYSDLKAKEIYEEYRFYDRNVMLYPAKDLIFFQADIHGNQLVQERIKTLRRVVEGKPVTIVTTYAALMTPQVLWEEKDIIRTERGGSLDESKLASRLVAMGYEKAYQVESPGQFSIRGGIVDIFDLTEENPYRIELWGDEVESIRSFDILSQRSIEKLESITVYPATEFVLSEEQIRKGISKLEKEADKQEKIFRDAHQPEEAHRIATQVSELKEQLLEFQSKINLEGYIRYFYENTVTMPELLSDMAGRSLVFYIDEPARVKEQADAIELEFRESMEQRARKGYVLPGQMNILYSGEQVAATLEKNAVVTLATMETKYGYFRTEMHVDIAARNIAPYNNSFEALVKDLKKYKKNGYRVLLILSVRPARLRQLVFFLKRMVLHQKFVAAGFDVAEVLVQIDTLVLHVEQTARDVRAVVGHAFQICQQIGQHEACGQRAFAALETGDVIRTQLVLQLVDDLLQRLDLPRKRQIVLQERPACEINDLAHGVQHRLKFFFCRVRERNALFLQLFRRFDNIDGVVCNALKIADQMQQLRRFHAVLLAHRLRGQMYEEGSQRVLIAVGIVLPLPDGGGQLRRKAEHGL